LYATPEQVDICIAARTEKAGADFRVRSMPILTFRSYINSVAFLYKTSERSSQPIVPSSLGQFPNFNAFFNPLLKKAFAAKVPGWKGDPTNTAITEEELITVVGAVNEKRPLEVQRRNCLLLRYATAYRAEVLARLEVDSLKPRMVDGKKAYEVVVATMKNHPAKLSVTDQKLLTNLILMSDTPSICPVRAIDSQIELFSRIAVPVPPGAPAFLFRSIRNTTTAITPGVTGVFPGR
jgi:hypothetical protein